MADLLYPTDKKTVAAQLTGDEIRNLATAAYCLKMSRPEVLKLGLRLVMEHYADAIQAALDFEREGGNLYEK
jgi:hypothetical protein